MVLFNELCYLYDVIPEMFSINDFNKLKNAGELPEGVRDENDYKEYLEEKTARNTEKEVGLRSKIEKIKNIPDGKKKDVLTALLPMIAKNDDMSRAFEVILDYNDNDSQTIEEYYGKNIESYPEERLSRFVAACEHGYEIGQEKFDKEDISTQEFAIDSVVELENPSKEILVSRYMAKQLIKQKSNQDEILSDLEQRKNKNKAYWLSQCSHYPRHEAKSGGGSIFDKEILRQFDRLTEGVKQQGYEYMDSWTLDSMVALHEVKEDHENLITEFDMYTERFNRGKEMIEQ